jgi:hypothetical protein
LDFSVIMNPRGAELKLLIETAAHTLGVS